MAERALGEFGGPSTRVSSTAFLKATNGVLKVLSGLPKIGGAILSERGSLSAFMGKELLSSSMPLGRADRQGGRQAKLSPSFPQLSLGSRFV